MVRRVLGGVVTVLMMGAVAACGESAIEADPTIADFVGTWDADSLTVTNDANPTEVANVLGSEFAGSFVLQVQPSGAYTATLTVLGNPGVEIGDLDVIGTTLQLKRTFPPPASTAASSFVFTADDYVILDGDTEFDFNFDDIPEAGQAHFELRRR